MKDRHSPRMATTCTVTLSSEHQVSEGRLIDLSVPGCRIETALALEKGDGVQLRIQLPNQPPLRVNLGVVRWRMGRTIGVEFIRMTEDHQARLRAYAGHVEKRVRPSRVWTEAIYCTGISGV